MRRISCLAVVFTLLATVASNINAQDTAFTYQGRLNSSGTPASGTYDLVFTLFATNTSGVAITGPVTNSAIAVSNGLFLTSLDFNNVFDGASRWLEIAMRTNGSGTFSTLAPRQQITPTPYAITATRLLGGFTVKSNTNGTPNIIGGASINYVTNGVVGATISGGGAKIYPTSCCRMVSLAIMAQ